MGKETIKSKVKNLVYKVVLPIYLWSIGFKTLKDYIDALERDYELAAKFSFISPTTGEKVVKKVF